MLKALRKVRKSQLILFALLTGVFFCSKMCTIIPDEDGGTIRDGYGQAFAGSAACMNCHRDIYLHHTRTGHFHDSRPASDSAIKGSFENGKNRFVFNDSDAVVMEHTGDGWFQTAYIQGKAVRREPFDIVIGSGKKGQSYIYYDRDGKMYQLPISYSTALANWCNSPGYFPDSIRFNRQVTAYCLECHTTYAGSVPGTSYNDELIDRHQIVYGIDCERCHGPAAEHVKYQTANPSVHTAKFIINPARLSRQQRMDACALCHSGARVALRPAFSFRVGDTLSNYSATGLLTGSSPSLDVHGNQYGLLISSKCYIYSQMDCSSCHDVHVKETNQVKTFSTRCLNCHNEASHHTCTMRPTPGLVLTDNCIDCHMPAQTTKKIAIQPSGQSRALMAGEVKALPIFLRTHRIAIYPESTKEYLEKINAKAKPRG